MKPSQHTAFFPSSIAVGLVLISTVAVRAAPEPALTDAGLRRVIEEVLPVARRKLLTPVCRRIFSEFRDGSGETLERRLEVLRETPATHLMAIPVSDGAGEPLYSRSNVLAVSRPGAPGVRLCATRFRAGPARTRAMRPTSSSTSSSTFWG